MENIYQHVQSIVANACAEEFKLDKQEKFFNETLPSLTTLDHISIALSLLSVFKFSKAILSKSTWSIDEFCETLISNVESLVNMFIIYLVVCKGLTFNRPKQIIG